VINKGLVLNFAMQKEPEDINNPTNKGKGSYTRRSSYY
jgi:hypothetical protein